MAPQPAVDNFSSHLLNSVSLSPVYNQIDSTSYTAINHLERVTPPQDLSSMPCQVCGKVAGKRCSGCHEASYCSSTCQTQHWATHRDTCKDIQLGRHLQRVADILHEVYLNFRENTWDTPIDKIEVHPDHLTIHDGDQRLNTRYFTVFPNNFIGNDYEVKMAVLTVWMCVEPYAFLHNLIMPLLKGDMSTYCLRLC